MENKTGLQALIPDGVPLSVHQDSPGWYEFFADSVIGQVFTTTVRGKENAKIFIRGYLAGYCAPRGRALPWQEIPAPAKPSGLEARLTAERASEMSPPRARRKWVPPADHPWRQVARRG
jgi:hypothetical protein